MATLFWRMVFVATWMVVNTGFAHAEPDKKALKAEYAVLLGNGQFNRLEEIVQQQIKQYESKQISADALADDLIARLPANMKGTLPDVQAWVREKPKSYAARYYLGLVYLNLGREARGDKWASETSEQQFADMRKYMRLAAEAFVQSEKLYERPYPSYRALVQTAGYLNDEELEMRALRAAARLDPQAYGTYVKYVNSHNPRWGGSYEALAKIVELAKKNGMNPQGVAKIEAAILGWRAMDEESFTKNRSKAADYWLEAYKKSPGSESMGRLYNAGKNARAAKEYDRAIAIYSQIVTEFPQESNAWFLRGTIYYEDKQDYKRAFDDYLASAKLGNKYAQNNVGYIYQTGKAGTKNLELAKQYYRASADQGFDHAKEKLKLLEEGKAQD